MRLLVDVGNTALKVGVKQGAKICLIEQSDIQWQEVSEVVVAQVGPADVLAPIELKAAQLGVPVIQAQVTPSVGEISCAYPQYQNLGIDRWLGVIAGHSLYRSKHCVVVDSGTASKVDVVTRSGEHLGGWILPGLDMMIDSLVNNTQKVFSDDISTFEQALGINTPNAVKNGALMATLGAVEAGIAKLSCDFSEVQVVFAGGYGELLQKHFARPSVFVDELVLVGLESWRNFMLKTTGVD